MWKKLAGWVQEHPYSYWLVYMIFYLTGFFLVEQFVPFLEGFIIPYISWLILMPASLLFYLFYDKEDFLDLCMLMFSGMTISLILYVIFPNGLQLRTEIVRDNFCSRLAKLIYRMDTPTNVCPSIHVASSVAISIVTLKSRLRKDHPVWAVLVVCWMVLICVSTFFVKQHSIIDALCGIALTALLCIPVYGLDWRGALKKTRLHFLV